MQVWVQPASSVRVVPSQGLPHGLIPCQLHPAFLFSQAATPLGILCPVLGGLIGISSCLNVEIRNGSTVKAVFLLLSGLQRGGDPTQV